MNKSHQSKYPWVLLETLKKMNKIKISLIWQRGKLALSFLFYHWRSTRYAKIENKHEKVTPYVILDLSKFFQIPNYTPSSEFWIILSLHFFIHSAQQAFIECLLYAKGCFTSFR